MAKHNFDEENICKRKENSLNQNKPKKIDTKDLSKIQNRFDDSLKDIKGLMDVCITIEQSSSKDDSEENTEQELLRAKEVFYGCPNSRTAA